MAGMKEEDYRRVTYDITLAAARLLARLNPAMTFIYVSGLGTDSSLERGRSMWARVKGKTENDLLRRCRLRLPAAYMFRPGGIVPLHGVKSKTRFYQAFLTVFGPLMPGLLYAAVSAIRDNYGADWAGDAEGCEAGGA